MKGPTIRALVFPLLCLAALSTEIAAQADSFVLRAGRIYPVAPGMPDVIEKGIIVVRGGRIEAVGADVRIPPDLPLLERPDAVVVPGFVAAITPLGGEHRGDESIAAGYRAVDTFDRYASFATTLAGGVTTVHLSPGEHRLLAGQGAVVKLAGSPDARVVVERADLSIHLGAEVNSPPRDETFSFPASSDVAIPVPAAQRPGSRMGQLLAIDEELAAARAPATATTNSAGYFTRHRRALAAAWDGGRALRIGADRATDLLAAMEYLSARGRRGYLVGGAEAHRIADRLRAARVPLVFRPRSRFHGSGVDIGTDPDALSTDFRHLARLTGLPVAFGVPRGESVSRLRLVAVAARGAGVDAGLALAAITRIPAEILGVSERVGSLRPGRDADLVVLTDDPLAVSSHVLEVFVDGLPVHAPPRRDALVVRGGTVWAGPGRRIEDGEVLIEDGRIVAVGESVPHPPHARVIDAGPDAFITPGFIDARGHLGMQGDRGAAGPHVDLTRLVGSPDVTHRRVASAGITTVLMSPYQLSGRGSRLAAVKTAGRAREERVVRDTAAVAFTVSGRDPATVKSSINGIIEAGRKYLEKWKKYEKELAEYLEKQKRGEAVEERRTVEEEKIETIEADPVTGTWEVRPTSGPVPTSETAKVALRLQGSRVEGRVIEPVPPVEVRIVMTLSGRRLTGTIEVDEELPGVPQIEAEIPAEDRMRGSVSMLGQSAEFEATRIDKSDVEFRVTRQRRSRGGKPLAPEVDPALEPIRALIEKKIPAAVEVSTPAEIREVLDLFDELELPLILLGARGVHPHLERVARDRSSGRIGVVLPRDLVRERKREEYHQGDQLARRGVPIAFQSLAEDGARDLPYHVLWAVERGLSADAALSALTVDAARMYKLDDRVGSLAAGKDGDLLIFSGHPFREGVTVERVIVNGKEVES